MPKENFKELIKKAKEAMQKAYEPYSNFKVGAALLTQGRKIYTGCNVENASYGGTNCAERVAVQKAVSEGDTMFKAIAIVTSSAKPTAPCGLCRQVLYEFSQVSGINLKVIIANKKGSMKIKTIKELLPLASGPKDLGVNVKKYKRYKKQK